MYLQSPGMYRKVTFAKFYKLIYYVDGNAVYLRCNS